MRSMTTILNEAHLNQQSTLGAPIGFMEIGKPLNPSINYSTAYSFQTVDDLRSYHENKYSSVRYARDSSPLVSQIEYYLSKTLSDSRVLLFNSGMSAISTALNCFLNKNSEIITIGSYYRKSASIFMKMEKSFGIKTVNYKCSTDIPRSDSTETIILIESPSNPFLRLVDVEKVRSAQPNAKIILDITFQGLMNVDINFEHVDIVVSSCTKYIGGHNDLFGGFLATNSPEIFQLAWEERSMRGGIIDNNSAYLLFRSLRTYDIRMQKTLENTSLALEILQDHPNVLEIYYPGSHANADQKDLFSEKYRHGGGVITFEVSSGIDCEHNISKLNSSKMAPSFGSVDTLIELPASMSHYGKTEKELLMLGLTKNVVRLSVGHEPIQFIRNDLIALME
jgi:cystathionine gamma-synthase